MIIEIHNFRCSYPKNINVGLLERPFLPLKLLCTLFLILVKGFMQKKIKTNENA